MKKRTMVMALTAGAVAGALTACGGGTKDNGRFFHKYTSHKNADKITAFF